MTTLSLIITSVTLGGIAFQDFKERQVTGLLFLLAFIGLVILHYSNSNYIQLSLSMAINLGVVILLSVILYVYATMVLKKQLSESIGLGDLFMFGCMAVAFPTISFLTLFSFSIIFSFIVFKILEGSLKVKTVPLAGLQAVFLVLVLLSNAIFKFSNLYVL